MGIVAGNLTSEEIQQAIQQAQQLASNVSQTIQPNQFVFFAAFDGTNNDRDHLELAGDPQWTNSAQLENQAAQANQGNENFLSRYYKGVGTADTLPGSSALPWQVTQQIINTAEQAYNDFAAAASAWLNLNPGGSITTVMTSFSRGGASAAIFSQLLFQRGLIDPQTGATLIEPGKVGVAGALILDPVLTGVSGNMDFAPNSQNITVVRSMDEFRTEFPAAQYNDPSINTVDFYGNHCDVGGCYVGGIGSLTLSGATDFFRNLGLNMGDIPQDRLFDSSQTIPYHTEGVDSFGNRIWDEYGTRGNRLTSSVGVPATIQVMSDGSIVETFNLYDGRVITRTTTTDGNVTSAVSETGAGTLQKTIGQYGGTLLDALTLVTAIQSGQPLPLVASGLKIANDLSNLNGSPNLNLSGTAYAASGILSLMSLDAALERGDTLGAITAGAQAVTFGATAYANFAEYSGDKALQLALEKGEFGAAGDAISAVNEALPYLNLINSVANGDVAGTAVAAMSMMGVPYIGWAYAVYSIVSSLFGGGDDIPDPWGNGRFVWNGTGISYQSSGETGGNEAVANVMSNVITTLNAVIERERQQNPGASLGIIPNRMPSVGYDMSGYRYTDIDPLTGTEKHPGLRFDTSGNPYNADPGSPESYQSIIEGMVRSALARGAIAPMWEVQTAKMQTDAGDPRAGLTEEERAARDGRLAAPITGTTQIFRPVALDLDGDGIEVTDKAHGVAFDVDDSGYMKQTAWVKSDDAFLVLDRDYNGQFDTGRELFSNGTVGISRRGLAGMAWVDANYDGKLTNADPVWDELEVWRDNDQDGQQDAGEVQGLDALGITELNYAMSTYTQGATKKQLASPDLDADKDGTRVTVVPEGILVQTSENGHISLLVTRIDDETLLEPNRDGITGYEDIEIIVNGADLLINDTLGGILGRDLTITGLDNFRHGTGFMDANGFVHFIPEANYNGTDAGFEYKVLAQNGQVGTSTVDITLQGVNDAPTLNQVKHTSRPVYGYTAIVYDEGDYVRGGNPVYAPYTGHTTPIAYEDTGAGQVVGADIDDSASSLTYTLVNQPQYGAVSLNANGTFQYTSWKEPNTPSDHVVINGQYAGERDGNWYTRDNLPSQAVYPTTDVFQVRITDPSGASTIQAISVPHYGPYLPPTPEGGGGKKPIAIDLNGNGFDFVDVNDSNVFFDVNDSGWKRKTAWVGKDDGLLVYDIDGDGKIDKVEEIGFAAYKNGAQSDLEGLAAFDSNGDGKFDASDEKWAKFGVWQDVNQDGVTDTGEFHTLGELGIIAVNLTSDGQFQVVNGQTVHGMGNMVRADGTALAIADVTLAYSNETLVPDSDGNNSTVNASPFSPSGEELKGTDDKDLILGKNGNNIIYGYAGDDVVFEDGGNDIIDGGDGNDLLYAGADNDLVMGGTGDDAIYAGLGDDLVFGGDGHDAIFAEGGNDVVFGGDGNDLISGGWGNDVLSGDAGDDQVYGESGNDALFGRDGNDELVGMDDNDRLDGGAGNDLLDGGTGADIMLGGAGNDVYMVDDANDSVNELADEGIDTIQTSVNAYVLGANVENLTLTGSANLTATGNELDNVLLGNRGNNSLYGAAGNDTLDGSIGIDMLAGGAGNDSYVVDNIADSIVENSGGGNDTVNSNVSYQLSSNIENLTLTGVGDITGIGNELDNILIGNSGNNALDGGAGNDYMAGGLGDDTYIVGQVGDVVIEQSGEGVDQVVSSIDYTLGANLDNLLLSTSNNLNGTGNQLNNHIVGNNGSNKIDGQSGADQMLGQAGDDTYVVDNTSDVVVEAANEGEDSVLSEVNYALSANVENLTLTGIGDNNATGNELDNLLIGNAGNNILDGGLGADTMSGGAGDDTYIADNLNDHVSDIAFGGMDTVKSSVSFVLPEYVEQLQLTGVAAIDGTGNNLDNTLFGNTNTNILDGSLGADSMTGGDGDDIYYVDNVGDTVIELTGGGYDTARASITFTAPENVERIELLGNADTDAIGNQLDNVLIGNSGNNRLDGRSGIDFMVGGAGDDVYVVDATPDIVIEAVSEGSDTVYASATYSLSANIENLTLTGQSDINATGNDQANTLIGNTGRNVLDGGTGIDLMAGGFGNDDYVVDDVSDTVIENMLAGVDTIYSSVSYVLPENVENLILTGSGNIDAGGNSLDNALTGNDGDNYLAGGAGNDIIDGRNGNDILYAGKGNDTLTGGSGNDVFIYNLGDDLDNVSDADGTDTVRFGEGLSLKNVSLRVTQENGIYTAHARVLNSGGCEQTDQGFDFIVTKDAWGRYVSPIEQFEFSDGSINTFDDVLIKTQVIYGKSSQTSILTGRDDDIIYANARTTTIKSGSGNDQIFAGYNLDDDDDDDDDSDDGVAFHTAMYGEGGNDYLVGSIGNDTLDGGCGIDILKSMGGKDTLTDLGDSNAFFGGSSADNIVAGNGNDFVAGGTGNDTLQAGSGNNIIAFNLDDGKDIVLPSAGARNTLSISADDDDFDDEDLRFKRSGQDLLLDIGEDDRVSFKDWYAGTANQNFVTLQIISISDDDDDDDDDSNHAFGGRIENYDFQTLVSKFDAAKLANPSLNSWKLMNGLLDAHLSESSTAALGGDLATGYAETGTFSTGVIAAQDLLRNANFGSQAQKIGNRFNCSVQNQDS